MPLRCRGRDAGGDSQENCYLYLFKQSQYVKIIARGGHQGCYL